MLVARAFVWSVSPRALLAVLALSLSVAYALVSAGSLGGLQGEGATLEEAVSAPGWILHDGGETFAVTRAPADATLVHVGTYNGTAVATIVPYPYASNVAIIGSYLAEAPDRALAADLDATTAVPEFAPPDHVVVPPQRFDALVPDGRDMALFAFIPGEARPEGDLDAVPWEGIAPFYDEGADQIRQGLIFVVLASGAIAALLAAGFVHLEVLARRADLATLEALAGRGRVRRVVALRVIALVGAGLVFGTAGSFAVLTVARVAVDAAAFQISPRALVATWLATGTGGLLFGLLAGRQALAADHRSRSGGRAALSRRFRAPGRLRFLVVTPRLFAAVFAATLVAGLILSVVLAASSVPVTLFGTQGGEATVTTGSGNPLRGTADRFLAENAAHLEGVTSVMAETYVPTTVAGKPLLVKGTDFDGWRDYEAPRLVAGAWPTSPEEATIGARAARLLDIGPGERLFLPSAYHRGGAFVAIVGIHETGGFADDEVFTSLDIAGPLAGIPPDKVTLFRVRLAEPTLRWADVAPREGIEVVSLSLRPENPPPLTPATVVIEAINFADGNRTRSIAVRTDGDVQERDTLQMGPHSRVIRSYAIVTPHEDVFELEVNPVRQVPAGRTELVIETPPRATPGETFQLTVQDRDGDPVADVEVLVDGTARTRTGVNGNAFLRIDDAGLHIIGARTRDAAAGHLLRVAPVQWNDVAYLVAERIHLGSPRVHNDTHFTVRADATLANLGGIAANETVVWQVDGADATVTSRATPASGTRETVSATLQVPFGTHSVGLLEATREITYQKPSASAPPQEDGSAPARTVQDVLDEKRRAAAARPGGPTDPTQAFLDKVFKSLDAATTVVVIATLAHSGVLVWVAVVRETRERQGVVRQLHILGAAGHQVEARAMRDTALSVLPAILLGTAVAGLLLPIGSHFGIPAAFGHVVPHTGAIGVLVRTGLALLIIALAASFYAVQAAHRSGRGGPDAAARTEADWLEAMS